MSTTALLISFSLIAQTVDKPSLQYYQQSFVIRRQDEVLRVPLQIQRPKPPLFVTFRKNDTFAVWDDRGLTIRRGKHVTNTRLPDIATSPKAYSREEILDTLRRIKSGQRSKEANALSGAKRLGKDAFFLIRWDESSGRAWGEALIRVDVSARKPIAQYVGRFDGLSTASKPIDDKLQIVEGKLAIIGRTSDSWKLSTYDPISKAFDSKPMGGKLVSYEPTSQTQGLFVEVSSYGATVAGRVDLLSGTRKIFYEGHQSVRFMDSLDPLIVLATEGGKTKFVNCFSGAVRTLPYVVEARRAGDNILAWMPSSAPSAVWLLSPDNWEVDARWRSGQKE